MTSLSDALAGAQAPRPAASVPSEFTPRLEVGSAGALIVTPAATTLGPGRAAPVDHIDSAAIIADQGLDPAAWVVATWRRATWQIHDGTWLESFRVTLLPAAAAPSPTDDVDLAALHDVARASVPFRPRATSAATTLLVSLADFQVGKSDVRGGTAELLARSEASLAAVRAHAMVVRPHQIVLADLGDAVENFENTASQDRTNDLSLTAMLRVWRRILLSWTTAMAELAPEVVVAGVPSNHGAVRRGKGVMGPSGDDYGIEAVAQVMDICAMSPALSHVTFVVPPVHDDSLAIELVGGKVLGLTHGHAAGNVLKVPTWWAGQALGRTPVGGADILVSGHWHHARVQEIGEGRWWFQSPTLDSGSSWWTNLSGASSSPAVMVLTMTPSGWQDLRYL